MQVISPKVRGVLERVAGTTFVGERRKQAEAIARNLKAEGLDLHFIARTTGLTFDEVLNV